MLALPLTVYVPPLSHDKTSMFPDTMHHNYKVYKLKYLFQNNQLIPFPNISNYKSLLVHKYYREAFPVEHRPSECKQNSIIPLKYSSKLAGKTMFECMVDLEVNTEYSEFLKIQAPDLWDILHNK
jgi:hypothetical protein